MKSLVANALIASVLIALASSNGFAQTIAPTPHASATQAAAGQAAQLQELTKKIEEQNAKIDMLSQEILKLQVEITNRRPGVMIGEGAPATSTGTSATSTTTSSPAVEPSSKSGNGNSHVVARGPTSFDQLANWASAAQVAPHDLVSTDQQTWLKAPMVAQLGMDWLVEVTSEHYYGPTTVGAIQEFIQLGDVNGETFVINTCDGT